jgi:DnaJ-class molecular chaperone
MPRKTSALPVDTRAHLFSLVTDADYRRAADHAPYGFVPRGDGLMCGPGGSMTKYGYTAFLAAGTASRGGGRDPGRYRLAKVSRPGKDTWWVLEHAPGNTYRCVLIDIPACKTCHGTADILCPVCGGKGFTATTVQGLGGPCKRCESKGFIVCPTCDPKLVVDGKSITKIAAEWD